MTDFAPRVIDAYFRAIAGDDTPSLRASPTMLR
jgi:hypothetical protein